MKHLIHTLSALCITSLMMSCHDTSSSSEDEASGADFGGSRADVTGTMISQNGSQSEMHGWLVALLERDTGSGRVAEADANGALKFSQASFGSLQTAVLLSPDFLIQSVLSMPSSKTKTIKQFFQIQKAALPRMIQKGGVINFQNFDGIAVADLTATDTDGDGVPDGISSLGLTTVDTDADGIVNDSDSDIDADGLINAFDSDDDGDGTIDALDTDANGNGVNDTQETLSDMHFKVGFEYITVQQLKTSSATTFKFIAKVRDGLGNVAVKIKSSSSLLASSTYSTSEVSGEAWDFTLADDGKNDDAGAKDLLYSRTVTLASGISPRTDQVVFFQLTMGEGATQFTAEFPYVFPELSLSIPTTSYTAATRTVTLAGDPFGSANQDFLWLVTLTNSDGLRVYESSPIAGSQRTLVLPSNVLQSGKSYTYKVTARVQDKVTGYSPLVVQSDDGTISN